MQRKVKWLAGGALLALLGGGAAIALGTSSDDADQPLTGRALDQAIAAALDHTGGGTVLKAEMGDDGAAYSVEIRLEDGRQVEVNLDEGFRVSGQETDDDGPDDRDRDD